MGRLRYWLLGGETRSLVLYACVAALFIAGPFLAGWLDAHGLPGAGLVLIAIVLAALAAGYAFYSTLPRTARSRELIRLGADLDVPYRRRMVLPHAIYALPSFRLMASGTWSVLDGIEGHHDGAPLLVFARSWTPDVYEATDWSFCAATTTELDGPTVQICPRHLSLDERELYAELALESDEFDRVWRVRTDDLRFASAVVDQRMMVWLLIRNRSCPSISEADGRWPSAIATEPMLPRGLLRASTDSSRGCRAPRSHCSVTVREFPLTSPVGSTKGATREWRNWQTRWT